MGSRRRSRRSRRKKRDGRSQRHAKPSGTFRCPAWTIRRCQGPKLITVATWAHQVCRHGHQTSMSRRSPAVLTTTRDDHLSAQRPVVLTRQAPSRSRVLQAAVRFGIRKLRPEAIDWLNQLHRQQNLRQEHRLFQKKHTQRMTQLQTTTEGVFCILREEGIRSRKDHT